MIAAVTYIFAETVGRMRVGDDSPESQTPRPRLGS